MGDFVGRVWFVLVGGFWAEELLLYRVACVVAVDVVGFVVDVVVLGSSC